jgi:hypothetical protein
MAAMPITVDPAIQVPALLGIVLGIGILARGMRGHVLGTRIADTATSAISAIALGEVRVHGIVEAAELTLTSPLQSAPCIYYRARIRENREGDDTVFREERSVGFRIRDDSGSLRIFPRGARWDVPDRFSDSGDSPPGLRLRSGPALAPANPSHEELVAQLLTVRPAGVAGVPGSGSGSPYFTGGLLGASRGPRRYEEARLEPGDEVTVLGRVLPFGDLDDPAGADIDDAMGGPAAALSDPEIAADIAEARAAGLLEGSAEEAWGNAAIPGFGIGHPTRAPEIDPAADPLPIASPDDRARFERTFDLAPDTLVIAAADDVPLTVAAGPPGLVVGRQQDRLLVGLLGALVAIGSAVVLAASMSQMIGP